MDYFFLEKDFLITMSCPPESSHKAFSTLTHIDGRYYKKNGTEWAVTAMLKPKPKKVKAKARLNSGKCGCSLNCGHIAAFIGKHHTIRFD
jgi:hypothetical protein